MNDKSNWGLVQTLTSGENINTFNQSPFLIQIHVLPKLHSFSFTLKLWTERHFSASSKSSLLDSSLILSNISLCSSVHVPASLSLGAHVDPQWRTVNCSHVPIGQKYKTNCWAVRFAVKTQLDVPLLSAEMKQQKTLFFFTVIHFEFRVHIFLLCVPRCEMLQ